MRYALAALMMAVALPPPALAQGGASQAPERYLFISGYGTAGLTTSMLEGRTGTDFTTAFNPIFHFQVSDQVHFASELEFEFENSRTVANLEYAEIDLMLPSNLVIRAGKFLLPLGDFIERLHPTWINRFPSPPPLLGHEAGPVGFEPLLAIVADIGVQAAYVIPMGDARAVTLSAFVSQGPRVAGEEDAQGGGMEMGEHGVELAFGNSVADNNTNKMLGGRIGFRVAPQFEIQASGLRSAYDDDNELHFTALNLAGSFHRGPLTVRGEFLRTMLETRDTATAPVETAKRWGFYAQGSLRLRNLEPVLRYAMLNTVGEPDERRTQVGLGLNYWLNSSTAVMAGLELNGEREDAVKNNRLIVHWSFGF